jgi:putative transposase
MLAEVVPEQLGATGPEPLPSARPEAMAGRARYCVHESGRGAILGLDVGKAETEAFWRQFLTSLIARSRPQRGWADAHTGRKAAIVRHLHFPGSAARPVPPGPPRPRHLQHGLRAALLATACVQVASIATSSVAASCRRTASAPPGWRRSARRGEPARPPRPPPGRIMDARPGQSRRTHRPRRQSVGAVTGHGGHLGAFIRDTNPLERFNKEIGRLTAVVGMFRDDDSLIRLGR